MELDRSFDACREGTRQCPVFADFCCIEECTGMLPSPPVHLKSSVGLRADAAPATAPATKPIGPVRRKPAVPPIKAGFIGDFGGALGFSLRGTDMPGGSCCSEEAEGIRFFCCGTDRLALLVLVDIEDERRC